MASNMLMATCPMCGLPIEAAALGAHEGGDRCKELAAANVAIVSAIKVTECEISDPAQATRYLVEQEARWARV